MNKLLAAWTPKVKNPPYLSINAIENTVVITVRSEEKANGSLGNDASVTMSEPMFRKLLSSIETALAHDGSVSLSMEEHSELLYAQAKLNALEAAGVDNWEWYGDAMEKLEQTT